MNIEIACARCGKEIEKAGLCKTCASKEIEDPICECGDASSLHVDACEQCVIPGCGCQEFEEEEATEEELKAEREFSPTQEATIEKIKEACRIAGCDDEGHNC